MEPRRPSFLLEEIQNWTLILLDTKMHLLALLLPMYLIIDFIYVSIRHKDYGKIEFWLSFPDLICLSMGWGLFYVRCKAGFIGDEINAHALMQAYNREKEML